jgi:hypothetical protein
MLFTDIPYSMVNSVAMGPTLLQSLEEKDKQKKLKLGLKYMCYNVNCMFIEMYISDL